jgi:uncharacterized protein YeaO (DUF488 family)
MAILVKNAQEAVSPEDGARVLVERRKPGGIRKESLDLRVWLAALAPSDLLQRWFDERPRQWMLFRRRYLAEICTEEAAAALGMLHELAANEASMTLLTFADEPERSHAAILRDLLQGARKPPSSTGPARAASARVRAPRPR